VTLAYIDSGTYDDVSYIRRNATRRRHIKDDHPLSTASRKTREEMKGLRTLFDHQTQGGFTPVPTRNKRNSDPLYTMKQNNKVQNI
jgi:hypothetical protein